MELEFIENGTLISQPTTAYGSLYILGLILDRFLMLFQGA